MSKKKQQQQKNTTKQNNNNNNNNNKDRKKELCSYASIISFVAEMCLRFTVMIDWSTDWYCSARRALEKMKSKIDLDVQSLKEQSEMLAGESSSQFTSQSEGEPSFVQSEGEPSFVS